MVILGTLLIWVDRRADLVANPHKKSKTRRAFHNPAFGQLTLKLLDLGRAPYVLYGVKYIDPVSLDGALSSSNSKTAPLFFKMAPNLDFEMCFGPSTLFARAETRLESRVKKFVCHVGFAGQDVFTSLLWICRPGCVCRREETA